MDQPDLNAVREELAEELAEELVEEHRLSEVTNWTARVGLLASVALGFGEAITFGAAAAPVAGVAIAGLGAAAAAREWSERRRARALRQQAQQRLEAALKPARDADD